MDFIERILHISPDGGSGAVEVLLVLVPVIAASIGFYLYQRTQRQHRP